ncbi:MAG: cation-translocating P-type ATPase [Betaproteobacteria bacterium]|nr:cation-translocating P-type ATPase [Betaproteobacteria bacterium]
MESPRTLPAVAAPHTRTVADVAAALSAPPGGLGAADAARRLAQYGPNELAAAPRVSPWSVLAAQFRNVLVAILLVATALSAFLGHAVEAVAIAVIVTFAILLGFVQEFRAERAMEALRSLTAPVARVLRDGAEVEIRARELVPGDVLVLRAGDRVAGDARLVEAVNLAAQEAALTGESEPVDKRLEPIADAHAPVGDRANMVFAGTAIARGRGRALVVATGSETEFGRIATLLESVESGPTPLQRNLDRLGRVLVRVALAIVAVIVVLGLVRGQPFVDMLVFGIALAVAVVPEALPAVVTISLALGVQRLVRRRALIRRLAAVETLGSTSVICSDKTGTLTKDEMTARRVYVHGELVDVTGVGYAPHGTFERDGARMDGHDGLLALLGAAALASDARIVRGETDGAWHVHGDPTEGALVAAAAKAGLDKPDLDARFARVHEIPFESETRRMTTLHATPDGVVAYAKGAPEVIVAACARESTAAGVAPLDEAGRQRILAAAQAMADDALRVLAVATRTGATPENAQRDLTFLGLVGMIDPPRPEVRDAIATCERAGIVVVMITGDHPTTARAVARELDLLADGQVVTGADLDAMGDAELARRVAEIGVYARVSPAHKLRVVGALQAQRHVVAMTGDGVNDAPALKKADIGVAMGISGTDVAREAAAMTLTDDNFASIVAAVEEGRGVYGNIKKYLMFLLSSNIGEIGLMAGAMLAGMPLPLTAVQILYVNLATDGLPALALAVDPPEADLMRRRPRDPRIGIFTRPVVALMLVGGLWSALVNLALFAWAWQSGRSIAEAMTMTFVCLVVIQLVNAYNFRSDRLSILRRPFANRWLNLAVLWEVALLTLVVYLPVLHAPFGTFALTAVDWAIVVAVALTIVPVLEGAKALARHGVFGELH